MKDRSDYFRARPEDFIFVDKDGKKSIIELSLDELLKDEKGTHTEWRTVVKGNRTFKQRFKVGQKEGKPVVSKPRDVEWKIVQEDVKKEFVPSDTVEEGIERLNNFIKVDSNVGSELMTGSGSLNFYGIRLCDINSIVNGLEKTIGKYNIKLDHIGWDLEDSGAVGTYRRTYDDKYNAILINKQRTENSKEATKESEDAYKLHREKQIKNWSTPPVNEYAHGMIEKLQTLNRFAMNDTSADEISVTIAHEGHHAIYDKYKLKNIWKNNMMHYVGEEMNNDIKCATVSDYGMSDIEELFAEVGAAVAFDIKIDPDVKQAYLKTMESIK